MKEKMIWGLEWFFGSNSQSFLLPRLTGDTILVHVHDRSRGRGWGLVTKREYVKLVSKDRHLYEVITNRRRKVYFDIDSYGRATLQECMDKILEVLSDAVLHVSGSHQPEKEKFSYHIVVGNYHLECQDDMGGVKGFCKANADLGFDWKVYNRNNQMKCINQSKHDGPVQAWISGSMDERDHCITGFFDPESKSALSAFDEYCEYGEPLVYNRRKQQRQKVGKSIQDVNVNPEALISLMPLDLDHSGMCSVALYYMSLGKGFEEFWDWAKGKCDSEARYKKWGEYTWPYLSGIHSSGGNKVTSETMVKLLDRTFPNVRKAYYTRLFMDNHQMPLDVDTGKEFACVSDFSMKRVDYLVFPMGAGKTKAIVDLVDEGINWKDSVIFLNCRVSLAQNIMGRLPSKFVKYDDTSRLRGMLKEIGVELKASEKCEIKMQGTPLVKYLVTTPNSLHYIGNRDYDLVVIDEFEMFMTAWVSVETHKVLTKEGECNYYMENWNNVCRLIRNAKKVVIMDALPSINTFMFFKRLGIERKELNVIGTTHKSASIRVCMLESVEELFRVMLERLRDNKKIYVFWPYKSPGSGERVKLDRLSCGELMQMLQRHLDRPLKGEIYTSDTMKNRILKEGLQKVNESWTKLDVVMVNQSVTIGVNFDVPDYFDSVFLGDASFVSNRELMQTSRRVRTTLTQTVYYSNLGGRMRDCYSLSWFPDDEVVKANVRDIYSEWKCKSDETVRHMFELANMKIDVLPSDYRKLPKLFRQYVKRDDSYSWMFIPDIEDPDAYERLCIHGSECVEDVLKIAKYQFRRFFSEDTPEEILADYWNDRNAVIKIKEFTYSEDCWVDDLLESLNVSRQQFLLPQKFAISERLTDILYNSYTFKRLDMKRSTPMYLVSICLREYFHIGVFDYDSKDKVYRMNERFVELYQGYRLWRRPDWTPTPGSFLTSECLV